MTLLALWAAVTLAHWPLLHLPYYWDEAGYYIPAAFDFFRNGSLIPWSTLSNAHPPLPSICLAAAWKLFGFAPVVTRIAMCGVAALALTAVWTLGRLTAGRASVAWASVLLTAIYPIFFAQSSLAHADLFAAAATLWALVFFLELTTAGIWWAVLCFSLAALAKETSIVTPIAIALWEIARGLRLSKNIRRGTLLLLPVVPLACWYLYHKVHTGFVFGNPEYLRYNATATLTPLRILLAFGHRLLHVTAHMNLFVLTLLAAACAILPVVEDPYGKPRAAFPASTLAIFGVVLLVNLAAFSVLGGALLTRYLLPLYPLVILFCVHTFYRRFQSWVLLAGLSAVAFVTGLLVNPPYRFAPEDNLAYADVIRLHQSAIAQVLEHYPHATVLTAWPVSDELTKPELGYVSSAVPVVAIDNFTFEQIQKAAQSPEPYTVALIFSTKYDPPHLPFSLGQRNEAFDRRFFDFHHDLAPEAVARLLDGDVEWRAAKKGQWVAVLHFNRPQEAKLMAP
ncbi:ArnT family glycosyltransferase [Silvibacterium acidisoli]|uniref:ArnT family glycosyltransferase n=1 Tax=Acidobacteriaceae bacterium ZG23-2 TaxID=2883246 RepID=UPI00406CC34F